jgi:hypothetical protein
MVTIYLHNGHQTFVSNLTGLQFWHCRLGHPSFDKMHFLHQFVPTFHTINTTSHFCDVCPLAKQKRPPFPNAGHKSTHVFYLIHCDIWGPYFCLYMMVLSIF